MKVGGMCSLDLALEALKLTRNEGMSQVELANATGATRSHVCRVVNKMAAMGYFDITERQVVIRHKSTKFYKVAPAWLGSNEQTKEQ